MHHHGSRHWTSATAAGITATTSEPATFDVWIGTGPIHVGAGVPSLPGATIHVVSDGPTDSWEASVNDLTAATTYSIVLTAIDAHGGQQRSSAQFTTNDPPPPEWEVTASVERIDLTHDADPFPGDAGDSVTGGASASAKHRSAPGRCQLISSPNDSGIFPASTP